MLDMNGLTSYPVFPNWVFTGSLAIDKEHINSIVSDVSSIDKVQTPFGYETVPNKITKNFYNLSRIVGQVFFDNVVSKFRLQKGLRNIESVDTQILNIKPGFMVNSRVSRHRWYQGAVFLSPGNNGSDIYLEMFDGKLFGTPAGVQEYRHIIGSEYCSMAFWPAHIPWGFTENRSKSGTLIYTTSFIIKK